MQQIERYGVIALVFLLVTIVAVSFWGDSKSPGFWSRLTGRANKKEAIASRSVDPALPAAAAGERAVQNDLPLSPAADPASPLVPLDPAPLDRPSVAVAPTASGPVASAPAASPPVAQYQDPVEPTWSAPAAVVPAERTSSRPAARPGDSGVYVVEKGDSLIGIASRMLGSKKRWTEIRDLNHGIDPKRLAVGMRLAMPASASTLPERSPTPSKLQSPARRSNTAPASKTSKNGGGTYVVQRGDTLKSIAERMLGNSRRWREIAASNPGVDPQRIHVGSKLRMPNGKSEPLVAAAAIPVHASSSRPRVR